MLLQKGLIKPHISPQQLGNPRFFLGLFTGVFMATVLSFFFSYWRECLRYSTGYFVVDPVLFSKSEEFYYNLFFAALATSLGMAFCTWFWFSGAVNRGQKKRRYSVLSASNANLFVWLVLILVARFGITLTMALHGVWGYDNHLDFFEDYGIVLCLLPLFVFGQSWNYTLMIYKAQKWMLIAFGICLLLSFLLARLSALNTSPYVSSWFKQHEEIHDYIDQELAHAEIFYEISYPEQSRTRLKQVATQGSFDQILRIKQAFARSVPVSLDTIILQKIVLHATKIGGNKQRGERLEENWEYAHPHDLYRQIKMRAPEEAETRELFMVLKEIILLMNAPTYDDWVASRWLNEDGSNPSQDSLTAYHLRQINLKGWLTYQLPKSFFYSLQNVVDKLAADPAYHSLFAQLPPLRDSSGEFRED